MPSPSTAGTATAGLTYDLVCIGFGASALSLAIALKERQSIASTVFLEQQPQASWKPCHSLISPRMKTSFLNDLVTSENPRSKFTFVSYLHATNQLVTYTNSGRIAPSRPMFADYLKWCAKHFASHVSFGNRVVAVTPRHGTKGLLEGWNVLYEDVLTGQRGSITTLQVVCAAGLQRKIPTVLSTQSVRPRVVHSSEALEAIAEVLKDKRRVASIAVVGNNSHAAEIFVYLHGIHGNHNVHWFTERSELKGNDETTL
jgi:L-ornithine N5-oxygenase